MLLSSTSFSWRDLLALLFVAAVILTAGLQLTSRWREQSNRLHCANNLRSVGVAIQMYANENRGRLPRTTFDQSNDPVPTEYTGSAGLHPFAGDGPDPNDVTAALYLLVRNGLIDRASFVCPSDAVAVPRDWSGNGATSFSNFPGRAHLSYGYANPYIAPSKVYVWKSCPPLRSEFALAADMGPRPPAGGVAPTSPRTHMMAANSPNHRGAGQNVLYTDIHVAWSETVYCGENRPRTNTPRDNIYAFGIDTWAANPNAYGAPQDESDSVMLPTSNLRPPPASARTSIAIRNALTPALILGIPTLGCVLVVWRLARRSVPASVAYDV